MRESLNESPVAQAVVIGVLVIAAAFLFLTQMKGSSDSGSSPATSQSATVTAPNGATADINATQEGSSATVTATVTAPPGGASGGTAAPTAAPVPAGTVAFEAGPGLPSQLVSEHSRGKTIVLLVDQPNGLEDAPLRAAVDGLRGDPDLAVYATDADGIARYSKITQGVGVSQVPALVVVAPGEDGGQPHATVSYGFRSAESVRQAVRDAVYRGVTRGYDPG